MSGQHFNGLSPEEAERLALLLEELGEAQQAIGKILRHGYESVNPLVPDSPTNRSNLEKEMGHVLAAMEMMNQEEDVCIAQIKCERNKKRGEVRRWLHHQFAGHEE